MPSYSRVKIARRWASFEAFLRDVGPRPSPRHRLCRIDSAGHYMPSNVHWTTRVAEIRSRTNTLYLTYRGVTDTLVGWAERRKLPRKTIVNRLNYAWSIGEALGFDPPPVHVSLGRKHQATGKSRTKEYRSWRFMLRSGLPVHPPWQQLDPFLADMGPCPAKHQLARLDSAEGYHPANCRWMTRSEVTRRSRGARFLEHAGQSHPVVVWSEKTGLSQATIHCRLQRGWSVAEALGFEARSRQPASAPQTRARRHAATKASKSRLRCSRASARSSSS